MYGDAREFQASLGDSLHAQPGREREPGTCFNNGSGGRPTSPDAVSSAFLCFRCQFPIMQDLTCKILDIFDLPLDYVLHSCVAQCFQG